MTTNRPTRLQTAARTSATLSKAVIVTPGATKLEILGRGNAHVREDGTAVVIFNVLAFASAEKATEAAGFMKAGLALEKKNLLQEAHDEYIKALNCLMSFSVLAENAPDYQSGYEVTGKVEWVKNKQNEDVLVINNTRPVAVKAAGASTASMFTIAEADLPTAKPNAITAAGSTRRTRSRATTGAGQ